MSRLRMSVLLGIVLAPIFLPAFFLDTERYAAYGAAAQALGVFLALVLATVTLQAQNHAAQVSLHEQLRIDRVGRTLGLHELFTGGEVNRARARLIDHLRLINAEEDNGEWSGSRHGGPVRPVALTEVRQDARIANYVEPGSGPGPVANPIGDAYALLWYFERAEAALMGGLLEESLFHKLLGRHIVWWDEAILRDSAESMRSALARLGDWVSGVLRRTPGGRAVLEELGGDVGLGLPPQSIRRYANPKRLSPVQLRRARRPHGASGMSAMARTRCQRRAFSSTTAGSRAGADADEQPTLGRAHSLPCDREALGRAAWRKPTFRSATHRDRPTSLRELRR